MQQIAAKLMWCMPLLLQALVSCRRLTWLQLSGSPCYIGPPEAKPIVSWTAVRVCMLLCGGRCTLCTGRPAMTAMTAASFLCSSSDSRRD